MLDCSRLSDIVEQGPYQFTEQKSLLPCCSPGENLREAAVASPLTLFFLVTAVVARLALVFRLPASTANDGTHAQNMPGRNETTALLSTGRMHEICIRHPYRHDESYAKLFFYILIEILRLEKASRSKRQDKHTKPVRRCQNSLQKEDMA